MDPRPTMSREELEQLRRMAPAQRARYLGEIARENLEQVRRASESEEGHRTDPAK